MRHASRVPANKRPAQHQHPLPVLVQQQREAPRRTMDTAQDLQLLHEPFPSAHHPPPRPHDELPPPSLDGLNHGPQAVGHPLRGLRLGARGHLHPDLPLATDVLPPVPPAV